MERCKRPKGEQRNFAPLNADYTTTRHQLIDTSGHSCRGIHSDTLHGFVHEHFPAITFAVKLVVHAGNALVLSRLTPFQFLLWLLWAMLVTTARSVKHAVSPRFFCHACMSYQYDTHSNQLRKPAVRLCS